MWARIQEVENLGDEEQQQHLTANDTWHESGEFGRLRGTSTAKVRAHTRQLMTHSLGGLGFEEIINLLALEDTRFSKGS